MATTMARPLSVIPSLAAASSASSPTTPPPSPHLSLNTTFSTSTTPPAILSHKRLIHCPTGPTPSLAFPPSPPTTPSSGTATPEEEQQRPSLLHPPTPYPKLREASLIYALSASSLAAALHHISTQPLPQSHAVFPWLHGLTTGNQIQLSFFRGLNKNPIPPIPKCLRAITLVKCGGNMATAKIKGAIAPDELLMPTEKCRNKHAPHCQGGPCFHDIDPTRGFSVRNFKIQTCKMATVSDIVVYGDDNTPRQEVEGLALLFAQAQATWQKKVDPLGRSEDKFNVFVLTDSFATLEHAHPDLVARDSKGDLSPSLMDFARQERLEMAALSKPSEIAPNVSLGQTPEMLGGDGSLNDDKNLKFDILIEASDYAQMPEADVLTEVEAFYVDSTSTDQRGVAQISFPSSGSFGGRPNAIHDATGLIAMCKWMYKMTSPAAEAAETESAPSQDPNAMHVDHPAAKSGKLSPAKIYIHCGDGYTETSLLALCYYMYANCVPARTAWIALHRDCGRNFFAYPTDKQFLESIERRVMWESPKGKDGAVKLPLLAAPPTWAKRMDGSLPSRILDYLYLGNLAHANNPGLLRELGITHVLSVGEPITWHQELATLDPNCKHWDEANFCFIDCVQDNGVDPLAEEFERCLEFIAKAKASGGATLVHCRVGVSRSATICIAEIMQNLSLSFPRAYCFVRARRLNVIIQPHLRFAYELLKWEEQLMRKRGQPIKREFEWTTIAREIALMNKPYCRD